jgi:hypothetical protein
MRYTFIIITCLIGASTAAAQSNEYGLFELGVGNVFVEARSLPYASSDYPLLGFSMGYFRSVNNNFSIGVQVPVSIFYLGSLNINGLAFQSGGFVLANFGIGASRANRSPVGFFGGAGIIGNYSEAPNGDPDRPYRPPLRVLGLAYQAGMRFRFDSQNGDAFTIHFTYGTDFKVPEKRLFDVKIVYSVIIF